MSRPSLRRLTRLGTGDNAGTWERLARTQRWIAYGMATAIGAIGFLMMAKPAHDPRRAAQKWIGRGGWIEKIANTITSRARQKNPNQRRASMTVRSAPLGWAASPGETAASYARPSSPPLRSRIRSVTLRLYDARRGAVLPFVAPTGGAIGLYVCGVTPYDTGHLGHAFTYLSFDVLHRYLEYLGHEVRYVQNLTDVDDDMLRKARESGEDYLALGNR